ncbi:Cytochrome P450 52A6 [Fusarium oxysporum f. sp. cubense race 1]|uniref:Cytochrome P450 52A6 n=1 Tax=Fusarium oxysporum f. sp. cubense (strain race 1) TaxID=1229664 RepID=N4UXI8_FUSC1|nr:Cytochrome P450 52A6 [Fusarium oxysporum f. sp. cubense race 1]
MNSLLVLALWAAGSCIAFSIANSYWSQLRYDAKRKTQGCQRAPRMPNKYPFAVDFFLAVIKADKEKTFPETIVKRYGKTVLLTWFKESGLGGRRSNTFRPLLGNGIFAVDGPSWEHSRDILWPSQGVRFPIMDNKKYTFSIQ